MYRVNNIFKMWEEDDYQDGCTGKVSSVGIDLYFQDEDLNKLVEQIKNYFDTNDVQLNSCDEKGRIDVQLLENALSEQATEHEIEQWKTRDIVLYSATYTMYVYQCSLVDLSSLECSK